MIAPSIGFGLFFNAASLSGKLHDLHDYIYNRPQLSIIGIVETWLHKDIPDDCLNVPDYNVFRFNRATRGGGVMLLIHIKTLQLLNLHVYLLVQFKLFIVMWNACFTTLPTLE